MSFYPPKIQQRFDSPKNSGVIACSNSAGRSASFQCGSFVAFSLRIDSDSKIVSDAGYQTNGCGYMIAAADFLVDVVKGLQLGELHGLNNDDLNSKIEAEFETRCDDRHQCVEVCIEALRAAFADYRLHRIEEFRGEKALVCTCFGVAEETIETHIHERSITTVDEITNICNAGGGCGSCRMLIQEMIDMRSEQPMG